MAVLQQKQANIQHAVFGAAATLDFPAVTIGAATTVPTYLTSFSIPANIKILALSAVASSATSTGNININYSSGRTFGATLGTGTITFTGTATGAGTCTVTITGLSPQGSQVISFAIGATNTPTQSGAALLAAIAALGNPLINATNAAGTVTIYNLVINTATSPAVTLTPTYQAVTTAATQTVSPTTATAFSAGTTVLGAPDNSRELGFKVPPVAAAAGQYGLSNFASIPVSVNGANTVAYPALVTGATTPPYTAIPCWDIIFPVTREITLVGFYPGWTASTTLIVTALGCPVVLDPTQPHNVQWTPNNTTIGAPSTY